MPALLAMFAFDRSQLTVFQYVPGLQQNDWLPCREYAAEKAEVASEKVHEAQASAVQHMRETGTNIAEGCGQVIHKAAETLESAREKVNPK